MANRLKMATVQSILSLHEKGWSQQRIAQVLGIDRGTVSRYVRRAAELAQHDSSSSHPRVGPADSKPAIAPTGSEALGDQPERGHAPIGSAISQRTAEAVDVPASPPVATAGPLAGRRSNCEPWREVILAKSTQGLSAKRIHQDLVGDLNAEVSYDSVRRFLRRLGKRGQLPFRRMECPPGEEAQVDFGKGAPVVSAEGKRRRTHLFRIVLSHSRKGYSEVSYRQTIEDFIRCLENALWYFGGCPKVLVIDNLRAAVKHPDWYDPELNPKFQAFSEHYGVVILPTKPYTPRHKGKVERGVGYAQDNGLKGRTFGSLEAENRHLLCWEANIADTRIHGTTKKQVGKVFAGVERPALQPLPRERFPFFHEAQRIVSRDGHVEVAKAYYSAPPEYRGRTVWVRWDARLVRLFNQRLEPIAVHPRREPGRFSTHQQHIAAEKISGVERGAEWLLRKVRLIGPQTTRWAESMLKSRGIEGVRVLQGLVALTHRHPAEALEDACLTAFTHRAFRLRILRQLLKRQADRQRQFEFAQEHPIIRPLAEYREWLGAALARSRTSNMGFPRHGEGVRGEDEKSPDGRCQQGPGAFSTRPRSGYPSPGCSPAEPGSVSPDTPTVIPLKPFFKEISS
ncbi:MAG: IS21 family transposase [Pirellulales bacterium]